MSAKKSESGKSEDKDFKLEMSEAGRLFIAIDQLALDYATLEDKSNIPQDIKEDIIEIIKIYKSVLIKMKK